MCPLVGQQEEKSSVVRASIESHNLNYLIVLIKTERSKHRYTSTLSEFILVGYNSGLMTALADALPNPAIAVCL